MIVRKAGAEDLDRILEIYEIAREYMRRSGNPTQWGGSYPEKVLIELDMEQGVSYVILQEERICGTFMFFVGEEPAYHVKGPYAVIHRIAGDGKTRGIVKCAVDYAGQYCDEIRIDTHRDNKTMQNALRKQGFVDCGEIRLENGEERIAYWRDGKKRKIFSSEYSENQLRHLYEPKGGVFIAESPNVIIRALASGCMPVSFLFEEAEWDEAAKRMIDQYSQVPVFVEKEPDMRDITGIPMTRGVMCAMHRPAPRTVEAACAGAKRIAVLENVVNPTNVGAIFRSAAALGVDAVLLTAGSCDPLYRRAIRVSMGTVFQIPWAFLAPDEGVGQVKALGFPTAAMALQEDAISIEDPRLAACEKLAVVLGTEGDGLAAETVFDCDYTVKIPMSHGVDSLNVAAAAAVAFWELMKGKDGASKDRVTYE